MSLSVAMARCKGSVLSSVLTYSEKITNPTASSRHEYLLFLTPFHPFIHYFAQEYFILQWWNLSFSVPCCSIELLCGHRAFQSSGWRQLLKPALRWWPSKPTGKQHGSPLALLTPLCLTDPTHPWVKVKWLDPSLAKDVSRKMSF